MEEARKIPMERYTVTVAPPGAESFRLLIPFPPTSSVSALATEVKRRASRQGAWLEVSDISLHLGDDIGGPILDGDDLLEDVIIDPKAEFITATSRNSPTSAGAAPPSKSTHTAIPQVRSNAQEVKLRVITPLLARVHKDLRTIPLLTCATITRNSTLREVKFQISNHLQIPILDVVRHSEECNCSFARQIDERALRNEAHPRNPDENLANPLLKFIVVHGQNRVQIVETEAADKFSLVEAVRQELGDVRSKEINFIGGTTQPDARQAINLSPSLWTGKAAPIFIVPSDKYSKLPVLSVCSMARHEKTLGGDQALDVRSDLDLHTSEAPIEISSLNIDLTIDELGLTDFAINGVLDVYVVERKLSQGKTETESGKDAIFVHGNAWIHPIPQSMRGMAMLLSSLRVFTDRIGAKRMEHPTQDAVLHIFNLLTRFPPAVRAVHILMHGKSPRLCERAALAQALYEVLKSVVPLQLIKSDMTRLFEGARLLFGLILEKAKHVKLREDLQMPYISSLKVLDLRNTFTTMEPIANPVQTPFGLVEEGYYEAFKEGGILYWKTGEQPLAALPLDERTRRVCLLSGGLVSELTVLDLNALNSIAGYANKGDADGIIPPRELSDLNHLSALCSRNELSVLPPSALPSAEAPALTLDREGLLAVYVGRAPCAQPGKDISIFRPMKGGEETIDVAIITQLLVPILEQREADGTAIFDAFGDGFQRKFKAPDEIIMVCVDCSSSMSEDSDFMEIRDSDSEEGDSDDSDMDMHDYPSQTINAADGSSYFCATLDEMKKSITEHESFTDMLHIVHDTAASKRRDVACKVLEILSVLASQELSKSLQRLEDLKQRVTIAYYRAQAANCESEITKLKTFTAGLNVHRQALADFLIYRSSNMEVFDDQWKWTLGSAIPKIPKKSADKSSPLVEEQFSVPDDFLCPISREVMDDPVLASDGFTFERNAIERWFQIRKSSPLTGLVLDNTDLRANGQLANKVKDWINGSDLLIQPTPVDNSAASSSRTRASSAAPQQTMTVRFFSRLGSFNRQVPRALSINTLYRLAFRGMKGRHAQFELHFKSALLEPSESTLTSANVRHNSVIHIDVPETRSPDTAPPEGADADLEELCLVKVYKNYDQMAFSYWIPRKTTSTFVSVVFKYWRHLFKSDSRQYIYELTPWTGMYDEGDGHTRGSCHDHWDKLSGFLNLHYAKGKLKNEKLCDADPLGTSEDDTDEDVEMEHQQVATPLVLKIFLGGKPATKNKSGKNLSRLDVLKSMFDAFVNRLLAYNFRTHMGLITFQSSAALSQNITHAIENFRHKVNGMNARGDTALWDALALANDQLSEYAEKFPNAKKRIICISDGKDTKSKQRSSDVSWSLFQNKVVVDSFCLGLEDNVDLRTISYLSGGYKFKPQSLEQAMMISEMEPVLNQLERPAISSPREAHNHSYDPHLRFVFAKDKAVPETVTSDIYPQRKEHPNVNDHFVQLSTVAGNGQGSANQGSGPVNAHSDSNLRTSRILVEIRNIVANPHPYYDVYLSEMNMAFWKVVMQGPPESAYSTGTFVLYIDMEEDYPAFPPKCRFTTPIFHPNINRHGKVCHSILDRNWTSDTTNLQVINTIYSLLLVPEFSDPVNAVVTLNFHWDEVAFRDEVKEHIRKHATKTRETLKAEILAE